MCVHAGNSIGVTGVAALASSLAENRTLTELRMWGASARLTRDALLLLTMHHAAQSCMRGSLFDGRGCVVGVQMTASKGTIRWGFTRCRVS